MIISNQRPISKSSPKQPHAASPEQPAPANEGTDSLGALDKVPDANGQKAKAADNYGKTSGQSLQIEPKLAR